MPKIDLASLPTHERTTYPPQYAGVVKGRLKKMLADAGGLTQFGVNLTRLKPGAASAHRHWHKNEDEFVYVLEGEAMLVEDDKETPLRAGEAAAFRAGAAVGHQLVNRSSRDVVFIEVGTRAQDDVVTYTDPGVDMLMVKESGRWIPRHRNGAPY